MHLEVQAPAVQALHNAKPLQPKGIKIKSACIITAAHLEVWAPAIQALHTAEPLQPEV